MNRALHSAIAITAVVAAGWAAPTNAASEAEFYKGKKISFIIGTSPGGTYDSWARLKIGRAHV